MAKHITLYSWNVNGLRSMEHKGFVEWVLKTKPDVLGIQETKLSSPDQLPEALRNPNGYMSYWSCATDTNGYAGTAASTRKGYSGVGLYSRIPVKSVASDFGDSILSAEGRMIEADCGDFVLFNVYFPNGGSGDTRLAYKMEFYAHFLKYVTALRKKGRKIIFTGDVNTAHEAIDLARPKENEKFSGFLPQERAWIDKVIAAGFVDTFRAAHPTKIQYSWWDQKSRARERNVGWRIDYFFVSDNIAKQIKKAQIHDDVVGSDHCPVSVEVEV